MSNDDRKSVASTYQEFEVYVSGLYSALGYAVTRDVHVNGNQIDLVCEKYIDGFRQTKLIIECKFRSTDSVGVDDVNKFLHLATNLISRGEISGAAIVTNTRYSKESRQIVDTHPLIALKTVSELESELFDFSHLYNTSIFDYERDEIFITYVSSSAQMKDLSLKDKAVCELVDDTILSRLSGPKPSTSIVLELLRHNLCDRACARCGAPQDGQRGKRLMIAAMSLRRMVAIEFGMWRSGRNGGSSGSVTVGYGKLREQRGGTRS